jgi:hypothetical protein
MQARFLSHDPDLDIYRAAKLLVNRHGEDASIRAAECADELLRAGDIEGSAIWRAIMGTIEELQRIAALEKARTEGPLFGATGKDVAIRKSTLSRHGECRTDLSRYESY